MVRTIVAVLRGGTSSEYPLSLKTGAAYLNALPEDAYDTRDILIDKQGFWHSRGRAIDPARALSQVDVVINALHGGVGEDGTVQRILERAGVPYTGSGPLSSGLALNKIRTKELLAKHGILTPQGLSFTLGDTRTSGDMARDVFARFGPPYIVKPVSEGASQGIRIAKTIVELPDILADNLEAFGSVLVEEFVRGVEATVGLIENFRDQELYALPPARVLPPEGARMLESQHHHDALAQYRVPSDFADDEKDDLMAAARAAHKALDLDHLSRTDFILTKRGPYLLEINALPGLYPGSAFPPMLESVGVSLKDFATHLIAQARE